MKVLLTSVLFIVLAINIGAAYDMYLPISTYQADLGALNRKYTNHLSTEYFERMEKFYTSWLEEIDKIEFERLSVDGKIDYLNFRNHINKKLYFHKINNENFLKISHLLKFTVNLDNFIKERRRGIQPHAPTLASHIERAFTEIQTASKNLEKTDFLKSPQQAKLASDALISFQNSLQEAIEFYLNYDPEFTWWLEESHKKLDAAVIDFAEKIKKHYSPTLVDSEVNFKGSPLGKITLEEELTFEFIPYTPEQLIAEAERQYAWCETEMKKVATALGYNGDWKEAQEYVKTKYVRPGEWPEMIVKMADEAINFVEEYDLMTIPELAKETWRTRMLTAEQQKFSPFFLGGEAILIAYPTSEMTYEEKMMSMKGNNRHYARAVVHHELIPGHHMQQFMNQRHYPYRSSLGTPFWTEGWALYWEFNLWDKNFAQSEEDKIGMLFWRMHRAARIIFSLKYHLGQMSEAECIDFLVEKVGHERANAEAEVRRSFTGGYSPLYQVAYMIGGLQIYRLKEEMVTSGKMSEKEFHDFIISNNNLPIELLRLKIADLPISKTYRTNWKFLE